MKLSIVIVNYRSWDCLENCLDSIAGGAAERDWEIIVVDNHSDDGEMDTFAGRYPAVRFYDSGRNGGFAFGCNTGAAHSSGETILFLNPDVIAEDGAVTALLQAKQTHPEISILTSAQLDSKGRTRKVFDMFPDKLTWFRLTKFLLRKLNPKRYPNPRLAFSGILDCDWVSGSVFMISRADFDRLGGWREDYWMYVEDCDFCLRARRQGLRVACAGDIRMMHLHGGSSRRNFEVSVMTRTEAIKSKHLYAHLNFRSLNRVANHLCVFLAVVPKLVLYSVVDLLTLRRSRTLRTRTGVLLGVVAYYGHAMRHRTWLSSQVLANR